MLEKFETVRTTLTLPTDLIRRSQRFIDAGDIPSRNAPDCDGARALFNRVGKARD